MLILSRHRDESIDLIKGGEVIVRVHLVDIRGNKARVGIEAEQDITIFRSEMKEAIAEAKAGIGRAAISRTVCAQENGLGLPERDGDCVGCHKPTQLADGMEWGPEGPLCWSCLHTRYERAREATDTLIDYTGRVETERESVVLTFDIPEQAADFRSALGRVIRYRVAERSDEWDRQEEAYDDRTTG